MFSALVLSLPTRNSTLRMRVWRALKECGAAVLRDGVYVLPRAEGFGGLEKEIRAHGGFAMIFEATPREGDDLKERFDRTAEYGSLVAKISAAKASLPALGPRRGLTAVRRLEQAAQKLARIDFFPGEAKQQAAAALASLKERYAELYSRTEPRPSTKGVRPLERSRYQKRLWATRKAPWVDRLASAWLIKRFIAAAFGLDQDPALAKIGAAVHFLDVGGIPVPDAKGLETLLKGAKERARSDDALLGEAIRVLDLLYSAYRAASA